eukprot:4501993-Pleurochrysis_carterae.AAC.1
MGGGRGKAERARLASEDKSKAMCTLPLLRAPNRSCLFFSIFFRVCFASRTPGVARPRRQRLHARGRGWGD